MNEQILDIRGMVCAGCAASVEKAAAKTSGVTEASVNLAQEKLAVKTGESFEMDELVQAVTDAGYEVKKQ